MLLPMTLYNLRMYLRKSYKENYMFKSEYKNREFIEMRLTVKLIFYLIFIVASLFMFVYKLAEYLSDY